MFVQYSFARKLDHPQFKIGPVRFGPISVVLVGIAAMAATTFAYLALA